MAITGPRTRADFSGFLPPNIAQPIFERAARSSVAMSLAQQVPLGAQGTSIPVITGKLTAGWVAEGARKPASEAAMALKTMTPAKLAVIAVVSQEVVRANPGNYMTVLRNDVARAFAVAFDMAAFHDAGPDGTAGAGPFTTYIDQTANAVEIGTTPQGAGGVHGDLTAALALLVANGKLLTGWALDNIFEPTLWGATDNNGRPLYVDLPTDDAAALARPGRLLGRPSYIGDLGASVFTTGNIEGYGGDWTQAAWGVVGGITYSVSTETAVTINGTLVSTWENNLVAIRAEAEYGWLVNDPDSFVKLTDAL
jgi:HK97 family phage major capsid protein